MHGVDLARAIAAQPRLLLLDATLDRFQPEEIDHILSYLMDPCRPWTLIVVTRHPDVIRHFDVTIGLGSNSPQAPGVNSSTSADGH